MPCPIHASPLGLRPVADVDQRLLPHLFHQQQGIEIAGEPLVREFLRPCWENLESRQNCAECEKCLRTQLVLLQCGELANYPAFRHDVPLAERISRLRRIATLDVTTVYEGFLRTGLPLSVEQAVADLVRRTHRYLSRRQRKETLRRRVGRLCGLELSPHFPAPST